MSEDGPKIVIEGKREDWPGGAQTLTPRDPYRESNQQTYWFGTQLDPGGNQVWFRITLEAIHRMKEETPIDRGRRLIDELLAWMTPDRPLRTDLNRFKAEVWDVGDTWIERCRD